MNKIQLEEMEHKIILEFSGLNLILFSDLSF